MANKQLIQLDPLVGGDEDSIFVMQKAGGGVNSTGGVEAAEARRLGKFAREPFPTLADLEADTKVEAGDFVSTLGFSTTNDRGGNDYEIGTFGAADGVFIIDLPGSGLQARRLNRVDIVVNNVAEMDALPFLYIGDSVEYLGYTTPGDGGGSKAEIGTGFGPADNGSVFDLSGSGLQARNLFPGGRYNFVQWGAVMDGVTDSSVAVSNALSYIIDNNSAIRLPAGDCLLSTRVVKSVTDARFSIYGDSNGISRFLVADVAGGLAINATDRNTQLLLRDIEFTATLKGSGEGFSCTMPSGGNKHNRSIICENVRFSVLDAVDSVNYKYFVIPLNLTGCWRPYLNNVVVSGPFGPGISTDLSDSSPIYDTQIGINLDDCYGPEVHYSYVWSCSIGISSVSSDNPGPEGFRMSNCNIVEVKNALKFERPTQEPTIWISDCHYNFRDRGLWIRGSRLVTISNCYPYNVDTAPEFGGTPEDIYLDNTSVVNISDVGFHFSGNPNRRNIVLVAATQSANTTINNCQFNSLADIGVAIGVNASGVQIIDCQFTGTIATKIDDQSSSALIIGAESEDYTVENQDDGSGTNPGFRLYRNSSAPLTNDNLGVVNFDGNNDAGGRINYSFMRSVITDPAAGAEYGRKQFFNMINGSLTRVAELTEADGPSNTALLLLVNDGVTTSIRRVSTGPADSQGVGFRALRVPN